jgi:hypothetical protein
MVRPDPTRVKSMSDTLLTGKLLAFPINIRSDLKNLPGANTSAYWAHLKFTKNKIKSSEYGCRDHIHNIFIFFITYEWAK